MYNLIAALVTCIVHTLLVGCWCWLQSFSQLQEGSRSASWPWLRRSAKPFKTACDIILFSLIQYVRKQKQKCLDAYMGTPTYVAWGGLDETEKFIGHFIFRAIIHTTGSHLFWNTWRLLSQDNKNLLRKEYEYTCVSRKTMQCFIAWHEQWNSTSVLIFFYLCIKEHFVQHSLFFYTVPGSFLYKMYVLNFICFEYFCIYSVFIALFTFWWPKIPHFSHFYSF